MRIDPVTLQIFANHAQAAADSMAFTLFRTAHSTFVKETEDFTTGLATPDGMTDTHVHTIWAGRMLPEAE